MARYDGAALADDLADLARLQIKRMGEALAGTSGGDTDGERAVTLGLQNVRAIIALLDGMAPNTAAARRL